MPNTLTIVFTSTPSNQPVEFQNPNSPGVYVTGIQQTNGTWQVIFTGVTKGTYGALTARLKNFPAISATIGASAAVLNIVPNAPLGTSASGTGTGTGTGISVTASTSPNGLINRILASGSGSVGTFAQIYQGATSNYTHLLAAGTVQYYQYQYVGNGGFYDDSLLSLVFQGAAPSGVATTLLATATNQAYNARSEANNGGTRYDSNLVFTFTTDSSSITVNGYGYSGVNFLTLPAYAWVNGVEVGPVGTTFGPNVTGAQSYALTGLPGTGVRTVQLYMCGQGNTASLDASTSYLSLTSVAVPSGFSGAVVAPVQHPNELLYVQGDSTTQGAGHGNHAYTWPRIINRDYRTNSDVVVAGHSSMVGTRFIDTAPHQQALLNEYKLARTGYNKGIYWFDSMVNDCYYYAFTPDQCKSFYIAFANLFLADTTLAADVLFFKSAIPTTSHNNAGPNSGGYPLFAYNDAMSAAVTALGNLRVKYADGSQLQVAGNLTADGTHVTQAGDIYVAGTINTLLNASVNSSVNPSAGGGTLTKVAAQQAGAVVTITTDSLDAQQYSADGGAYQTSNKFMNLPAGSHTFTAKLTNTPYTVVSTTAVLNTVLYGATPGVTLVGSGWTASAAGSPYVGYYTNTPAGAAIKFNVGPVGFRIYQNRQENVPQLVVSIDSAAGVVVPISGPGYNYDVSTVYTSGPLGAGTHTVSITAGTSLAMNLYYIELLGPLPVASSAPAPTPNLSVTTASTNAKTSYTVPGLGAATVATMFLVLNKPTAYQGGAFIAAIPAPNGTNKNALLYFGSATSSYTGLALNTYDSGFRSITDKTVLDANRTICLTMQITAGSPELVQFWVNGVSAPTALFSGITGSYAFTEGITLGGDNAANTVLWPGTIFEAQLYTRTLSATERQQTEAYLKTKFAIV